MEQRLPPAEVTRTALLDRFNSHTVNCKSCAVALSNLVKVRKVLRVASLAGTTPTLQPRHPTPDILNRHS
jgi:hypothetical protein